MAKRTGFTGPAIAGLSPADPAAVWNRVGTVEALGPFNIDFDYNPDVPSVSVKVEVYGVTLASIVIDPSNPNVTLGGDIGIASAKVEIGVDFSGGCLEWSAELCAPIIGCAGYEDSWCW